MRVIGHLPNETAASTFSDFLYVQGIANDVEPEKETWAVWVHSEDELEKARELLANFLVNPADPRFHKTARQARDLRRREEESEIRAAEKSFSREKIFRPTLGTGTCPLTVFLIVTSITVYLVGQMSEDRSLFEALLISKVPRELTQVRNGEVWRLITPIFLHGSILHIFFNMWCLFSLGQLIEGLLGTRIMGLLVLGTAVGSNLGQFYASGPLFGGMSGVVYGLLGYAWMRGKFDPASGIMLHPNTVVLMLIWFVLGFTVMKNIANTAHAVGLGLGMAWGYLASVRVNGR